MIRIVPLAGTLFASVAMLSAAEAPTANTHYQVAHVVVRGEHSTTYRDYLKKYSDALKKAGVQMNHVYMVASGNPWEFVTVRPIAKYASLDDANILSKVMSDTERAHMTAQRDQCTESVRVTYKRTVAGVGTGEPRKYRLATHYRTLPGAADAYTAAVLDLVPTLKKVDGARLRWRRVEMGGNRADFWLYTDMDKAADLDGPPMIQKAMGLDGYTAMQKKMAGLRTEMERLLYRYQPDLSFTAQKPLQPRHPTGACPTASTPPAPSSTPHPESASPLPTASARCSVSR